MAEVSAYTYKKVRDLMDSLIKYIEIQTSAGVKIIRIATSDPRVTYTFNRESQTQTYTVVLQGSDSDLSGILPVTIGKSVFFETAISTDAIDTETMTAFTLGATADQLTITHQLQIPQVV